MNREFLKELGLEQETIDKVMAEHGKTVQEMKPAQEELDGLKEEKTNLENQLTELQNDLQTKETELTSVDDIKQELENYKLKDMKTSVAVEAGIPLELAGRLSGTSEEEIKADAENFAGFVNKKQTLPLKQTEPKEVDKEEQAYASMLNDIN